MAFRVVLASTATLPQHPNTTPGSGCFGRIVDPQPSPQAVGDVIHVQRVRNGRKREQRERSQCQDRSDRKRGILIVRIDGALRAMMADTPQTADPIASSDVASA